MAIMICKHCGAKPNRGGKITFHKKNCPVVTGPTLIDNGKIDGVQKDIFLCCDQPMHRTDGAPYDAMCRHGRLLTDDCKGCRQSHNGILVYVCRLCGRQVKDAPHLAQGNEAIQANSQVR